MADFRRRSSFSKGSRRDTKQKDFDRSDRRGSGRSRERSADRGSRKDFNRSGRTGGRNFSRDRRPSHTEMTQVICDSCKKSCEVPFKPTSNKPIYCRDCFSKDSSPRSSGNNSNVFLEINCKLDKIMNALNIK